MNTDGTRSPGITSRQSAIIAGAGLLLAVNIVCVNLACKLVFLFKGIAPRTWLEKKAAKRSMTIYVAVWFVTLIILGFAIYARRTIT